VATRADQKIYRRHSGRPAHEDGNLCRPSGPGCPSGSSRGDQRGMLPHQRPGPASWFPQNSSLTRELTIPTTSQRPDHDPRSFRLRPMSTPFQRVVYWARPPQKLLVGTGAGGSRHRFDHHHAAPVNKLPSTTNPSYLAAVEGPPRHPRLLPSGLRPAVNVKGRRPHRPSRNADQAKCGRAALAISRLTTASRSKNEGPLSRDPAAKRRRQVTAWKKSPVKKLPSFSKR